MDILDIDILNKNLDVTLFLLMSTLMRAYSFFEICDPPIKNQYKEWLVEEVFNHREGC